MALSVYRADGHRKKGHATPALLKLWSTVAVVGVSTQPRPGPDVRQFVRNRTFSQMSCDVDQLPTTESRAVQLLAFAVLCIAQVVSAAADAPEYPSCYVEQQSLIAFSTASPTDTLKVRIVGTPCYKGRLTISITSANGVKLYSYAAGFKRHTAVQWDDPDMPKIAVELAKRIVAPTYKSTTADLPPWLPKTDYDEQTVDSGDKRGQVSGSILSHWF